MYTRIHAFALLTGLLVGSLATAADFRGVLTRVDPAKQEVAVEGRLRYRGQTMTFVVGPQTQILFGRQAGQLGDLSAGRSVRIAFEIRDGQMVVNLMEVSGPQPKTPAPAVGAPANPANTVSGLLRRVGYTDREIIVIPAAQKGVEELETTLLVADNVKISKDGKPISFEALKEGEQVVVQTEKRAGGLTAVVIQLGAAAVQQPQENKIAKVREILKKVDFLLGLAEQMQK